MTGVISAELSSQARAAAGLAAEYLRGRQSRDGGFCFYKTEYVDEPNLHDTYHAVAALTLLGEAVPRVDELVRFLDHYPLCGLNYLYFYAFTLDLVRRAMLVDAHRRAQIRDLPVTVPPAGSGTDTGAWLEGTLRTLQLKQRFAELGNYPDVMDFINGLKVRGGYGAKPNLWDTYRCLSILTLLGDHQAREDTRAFINRLQMPSLGFTLTEDSLTANLDIIYAGMECCVLLDATVKYPADVLAFVLSCQTIGGGFSRASNALPDIAYTHLALRIITLIGRDMSLFTY